MHGRHRPSRVQRHFGIDLGQQEITANGGDMNAVLEVVSFCQEPGVVLLARVMHYMAPFLSHKEIGL